MASKKLNNKIINDFIRKKNIIPKHKKKKYFSEFKKLITKTCKLSLKSNLLIIIFWSIKTEKKAGIIPIPIVSKILIKIEKKKIYYNNKLIIFSI